MHGLAGIKDAIKYSLERVAGHFRTIPRFVSCRSLGLMGMQGVGGELHRRFWATPEVEFDSLSVV